jgi:hypothetical protein
VPVNAVAMTVEFAFGFGPGSTPAAGDWVDVTQWVDVTASSGAVVATSGRPNVRAGITPGSLTLTLDNTDGRFNPRNTAGPYFGELDNATQVRIRTTYASVTRTRWFGFVDSGWPQAITSRYPTVEVTAHDVLGLLAQGDGPATAFDAFLAGWATDPALVLRCGRDEWVDELTGAVIPHTAVLDELDDPVITGGEAPFGQLDAVSYAPSDLTLTANASALTALFIFRIPPSRGTTDTLLASTIAVASTYIPFTVVVGSDRVEFSADTTSGKRTATTLAGEAQLYDDRTHVMVVHAPQSTGDLRIWIDGREATVDNATAPLGLVSTALVGFTIGGRPLDFPTVPPFQGVIDTIVTWSGHPAGTLPTLAAGAASATTTAWAEQRLDERITNLTTSMGVAAHVGTLDTAGGITLDSYRQGEPLALLQQVEDTEQGRVWVDRDGRLRFSRRAWAWDDTVSSTVQVTFSDDPTLIAGGAQEMLEGGTEIVDDPLNLVNVASVTSTTGRTQTVRDAASVTKYGQRNAVNLTGLMHPSDRQSRSIAEWLSTAQSTPQIQARQVSFRVEDNAAVLAPLAAQIEPGWLVRIRKTTTAGALDLYAHVIGMTHEFEFTGWTVTLTLDATRTGYSFLKWGTSNWGGSAGWSF